MPNNEQPELTPDEREWKRVERYVGHEAFHATEEEKDQAWGTFLELLVEAMEACLKDGTRFPGQELSLPKPKKESKGSTPVREE